MNTLKKIKGQFIRTFLKYRGKQLTGWTIYFSKRLDLTLLLNLNSYIDFLIKIRGAYDIETIGKLEQITLNAYSSGNQRVYFIDIGSNIGVMSLYMKKKFKELEVYSFEPVNTNYHQHKMNQTINNLDYSLYQLILGEKCKKSVPIYLSDKALEQEFGKMNMGMPSLYTNQNKTGKLYELHDVITFDSFWQKNICVEGYDIERNSFIIKIDVEGAEINVLRGMKDFINFEKNIIFVIELLFESLRESCEAVVSYLGSFNYQMYNYQGEQLLSSAHAKSGNYIFRLSAGD